jgi:hypothetical protein
MPRHTVECGLWTASATLLYCKPVLRTAQLCAAAAAITAAPKLEPSATGVNSSRCSNSLQREPVLHQHTAHQQHEQLCPGEAVHA